MSDVPVRYIQTFFMNKFFFSHAKINALVILTVEYHVVFLIHLTGNMAEENVASTQNYMIFLLLL